MTDETSANLRHAASDLKEQGLAALDDAKSRAYDAAAKTASAAKSEAYTRAEDAKDGLASQADRLASSLRSALDSGDDSIQAKVMATVADSVSDLSSSLRGKGLNELLDDAERFARRNPGAFVAAAALAGFAVARFARASSSGRLAATPSDSYGAVGQQGMHAGHQGMHHVTTHSSRTYDDNGFSTERSESGVGA